MTARAVFQKVYLSKVEVLTVEKISYISYDNISVQFNNEDNTFCVKYREEEIICNAEITVVRPDNTEIKLGTFKKRDIAHLFNVEDSTLKINYSESDCISENVSVEFRLSSKGLLFKVSQMMLNTSKIRGSVCWGDNMANDTFAMCIGRDGLDLRCALGPACSTVDNALYNRKSDSALVIDGGKSVRFKYNWDTENYDFTLETSGIEFQQRFNIHIEEGIISEKYNIDFGSINKNSTFKKPPAGWMTWYAVKFDAGEKTVLENVEFQSKYLKKYGADTIWIDWEWYHKDMEGRRDDGVDTFNPDRQKYPNGLKFISDKIKAAGFVPALWVGFTNDPSENEYAKENPEIILKNKAIWCGSYFYDFSHPKYLCEFLPKALKQVFDWGYEAVKFDTIPASLEYHDMYHMNMYNPNLTTKDAFRNAMKMAREVLGKNMYMLSCAAIKDQDLLWAADIFDAARVGNDVFDWEDYIKEGVLRTIKFYPMHNIVFYCDPDNVILRDEFNTYNQAASRIYFVSLLGLPMTFGDDFKTLQSERVDLIRKCLPVMDIHPMDINSLYKLPQEFVINLSIELPFESYNVVNVFNTKDTKGKAKVYLDKDLHLDCGEYHIYDFTNDKYIGAVKDFFESKNDEYQSKIFCVRKKTEVPQIVSTSRHISQGAAEVSKMFFKDNTLCFAASLVSGDEYKVALYIPEGFKLCDSDVFETKSEGCITYFRFVPDVTKEYEFKLKFI